MEVKFDSQFLEEDELKLTLGSNNLVISQNRNIKSNCNKLKLDVFYSTDINLISELNKEEKTNGILVNYQKSE